MKNISAGGPAAVSIAANNPGLKRQMRLVITFFLKNLFFYI